MRHQHSEFHFRHALFALQSPDGYVDALLESARGQIVTARPAVHAHDAPCELQMSLFAPTSKTVASPRYRHH